MKLFKVVMENGESFFVVADSVSSVERVMKEYYETEVVRPDIYSVEVEATTDDASLLIDNS